LTFKNRWPLNLILLVNGNSSATLTRLNSRRVVSV